MDQTAKPAIKLKLIKGGRRQLEKTVMEGLAKGTVSEAELEELKPRGQLKLVYSRPPMSEEEEADWLNFEDLNL